MLSSMCFRAERWLHRCGGAVLLVSLVACADDNPVSPSASPVPSNPVTPSPKPAPPGAPGSVKLTLSRTDVVFNAMAGAALHDSAAVAVTAASGAALSELTAIVRYAEGKPAAWLAVELDQTTLPAKLNLRAKSPSLPPGEYTATVRLAAPGASPESLSVTAHVATGPGIGINAAKICFTPTFTGPDARPDAVGITSLDGSPIDGLTAAIIYDPGQPTGWLSTSFTAPSAPSRLWLSSQKGVTPPGTYHATVQVSSSAPGVAPVSIRVTLEVRPLEHATLTLSLETVGLGGAGNGRLTATGIDCVLTNGVQGGDCEESYAPGTVVHVTVLPSTGQVFYYVNGCLYPGPCSPTGFDVTMSELNLSFTGGFGAPASTLNVSVRWEGPENGGVAYVDGPYGLRCEGSAGCSAVLPGGVGDFPLAAYGEYGARFLRWEGPCTGPLGGCTVHFDTPATTKNVTAVFHSAPSAVNFLLRGEGASGSVTVSPTLTGFGGNPFVCNLVQGVAQPGCSGELAAGAGTLTLTATPAPGSHFAGWEVTAYDQYADTRTTCAEPLSTTCVLAFVHGSSILDGYVNFAPQ